MNGIDVTANYEAALELAREVSQHHFGAHIHTADDPTGAVEDLAQSVVGTESVVRLIMSLPFDPNAYEAVIAEAADEVGRQFFPDVQKRFITSIDLLPEAALKEDQRSDEESDAQDSAPEFPALPGDLRDYLDRLIDRQGVERFRSRLWRDTGSDAFAARLERLRRHYPDAHVPTELDIDVSRQLSDEDVREVARHVAGGLSITFPWGFFARETEQRISVSVEYLVEREIRRRPRDLVHDGLLQLVALGLGPALRRCGGSVNRLLAHAFPDEVRPWMSSHVPAGFWDDTDNRREAVRWLVEDRLAIAPDRIPEAVHDGRITKSDFADAGLTWLLKEVYGWSVADALGEAYPGLGLWERMRRVPTDFWRGEDGERNATAAVRWALERGGVGIEDLRHQKAVRSLQAALRSWKLTAAFSIGFDNDVVRCLAALFPGEFERWEIANVSRDDWRAPEFRRRAFDWLLTRLDVTPAEIPAAIAQGRLAPASFKDAGLDGLLRVTGSVWRAVDDVFPGRFARWELTSVPRSHWRNRAHVREAVLWTLDRLGIRQEELGAAIDAGRIDPNAVVNFGLGSLIMGVFHGDVRAMCQVADVLPAEEYVPLSRYYRRSLSGNRDEALSWRLHRGESRSEAGPENELDRHVRRSRSIREHRRRRA